MKKVHIDGLPGLTAQGKKGENGLRGCRTFCNSNNKYKLDLNYNYSVGIVFPAQNKTTKLFAFPTNGNKPIIGDYVVNVTGNGTELYVVSYPINAYDISLSKKAVSKLMAPDTYIYTDESEVYKSIISFFDSAISENCIAEEFELNSTNNYQIFQLTLIDTWIYNGISDDVDDITVLAKANSVYRKKWHGGYEPVYTGKETTYVSFPYAPLSYVRNVSSTENIYNIVDDSSCAMFNYYADVLNYKYDSSYYLTYANTSDDHTISHKLLSPAILFSPYSEEHPSTNEISMLAKDSIDSDFLKSNVIKLNDRYDETVEYKETSVFTPITGAKLYSYVDSSTNEMSIIRNDVDYWTEYVNEDGTPIKDSDDNPIYTIWPHYDAANLNKFFTKFSQQTINWKQLYSGDDPKGTEVTYKNSTSDFYKKYIKLTLLDSITGLPFTNPSTGNRDVFKFSASFNLGEYLFSSYNQVDMRYTVEHTNTVKLYPINDVTGVDAESSYNANIITSTSDVYINHCYPTLVNSYMQNVEALSEYLHDTIINIYPGIAVKEYNSTTNTFTAANKQNISNNFEIYIALYSMYNVQYDASLNSNISDLHSDNIDDIEELCNQNVATDSIIKISSDYYVDTIASNCIVNAVLKYANEEKYGNLINDDKITKMNYVYNCNLVKFNGYSMTNATNGPMASITLSHDNYEFEVHSLFKTNDKFNTFSFAAMFITINGETRLLSISPLILDNDVSLDINFSETSKYPRINFNNNEYSRYNSIVLLDSSIDDLEGKDENLLYITHLDSNSSSDVNVASDEEDDNVYALNDITVKPQDPLLNPNDAWTHNTCEYFESLTSSNSKWEYARKNIESSISSTNASDCPVFAPFTAEKTGQYESSYIATRLNRIISTLCGILGKHGISIPGFSYDDSVMTEENYKNLIYFCYKTPIIEDKQKNKSIPRFAKYIYDIPTSYSFYVNSNSSNDDSSTEISTTTEDANSSDDLGDSSTNNIYDKDLPTTTTQARPTFPTRPTSTTSTKPTSTSSNDSSTSTTIDSSANIQEFLEECKVYTIIQINAAIKLLETVSPNWKLYKFCSVENNTIGGGLSITYNDYYKGLQGLYGVRKCIVENDPNIHSSADTIKFEYLPLFGIDYSSKNGTVQKAIEEFNATVKNEKINDYVERIRMTTNVTVSPIRYNPSSDVSKNYVVFPILVYDGKDYVAQTLGCNSGYLSAFGYANIAYIDDSSTFFTDDLFYSNNCCLINNYNTSEWNSCNGIYDCTIRLVPRAFYKNSSTTGEVGKVVDNSLTAVAKTSENRLSVEAAITSKTFWNADKLKELLIEFEYAKADSSGYITLDNQKIHKNSPAITSLSEIFQNYLTDTSYINTDVAKLHGITYTEIGNGANNFGSFTTNSIGNMFYKSDSPTLKIPLSNDDVLEIMNDDSLSNTEKNAAYKTLITKYNNSNEYVADATEYIIYQFVFKSKFDDENTKNIKIVAELNNNSSTFIKHVSSCVDDKWSTYAYGGNEISGSLSKSDADILEDGINNFIKECTKSKSDEPCAQETKLNQLGNFVELTNSDTMKSPLSLVIGYGALQNYDDEDESTHAMYYPHGYIKNYNNTLSFDDEPILPCTLTIKDFGSLTTNGEYVSTLTLPRSLCEDCDFKFYAYIKTSSSTIKKVLLGVSQYSDFFDNIINN